MSEEAFSCEAVLRSAGASGTEKDALLALAGEKPGLWDGLEEDDILGVLRQASASTGT